MVFEEEQWKWQIDDPLPPLGQGRTEKNRLRGQIQALNRCLHTDLIKFYMDSTGKRICWRHGTQLYLENRLIRPAPPSVRHFVIGHA